MTNTNNTTVRERTARKLAAYLANPTRRTIEENAPVLDLRNGKALMIERGIRRGSFIVSRDFGCTCREIARVDSFDALVDVVIEEGK